MQQNQLNQKPANQQSVPGSSQIPVKEEMPKKENFLNKIKEIVSLILEKIKIYWSKLTPIYQKSIIIGVSIFGVLVLLATIFALYVKIKSASPGAKPTATPLTTLSPLPEIITNPSRYATDSGVLAIEDKMRKLETELGNTQIDDLKLSPPNLFFDVNFEK